MQDCKRGQNVTVFYLKHSFFRKKRSCVDNLFVFDSIIQSRMLTTKEGTHTIFVDFLKAFASISHEKLRSKIFQRGVSGKITRVLRNINNQATIEVNTNSEPTDQMYVSKGVLQGECTIPILFALYIADLESTFRQRELEGQ